MRPFRDIDLGSSLNSNKQKMATKVDSFKNEEIMAMTWKYLQAICMRSFVSNQ